MTPARIAEVRAALERFLDCTANAADVFMLLKSVPESLSEVERLRAALERIATGDALDPDTWAAVARAALGKP